MWQEVFITQIQAFFLTMSSMWVKKGMWQLQKNKKVNLPFGFLIKLGKYLSTSTWPGQTAPGGIVFFSGNYNLRRTMINWSTSRRKGTGWGERWKVHHVRSIEWVDGNYLSWKRKGRVTFFKCFKGIERWNLFYRLESKTNNMKERDMLAQQQGKTF